MIDKSISFIQEFQRNNSNYNSTLFETLTLINNIPLQKKTIQIDSESGLGKKYTLYLNKKHQVILVNNIGKWCRVNILKIIYMMKKIKIQMKKK